MILSNNLKDIQVPDFLKTCKNPVTSVVTHLHIKILLLYVTSLREIWKSSKGLITWRNFSPATEVWERGDWFEQETRSVEISQVVTNMQHKTNIFRCVFQINYIYYFFIAVHKALSVFHTSCFLFKHSLPLFHPLGWNLSWLFSIPLRTVNNTKTQENVSVCTGPKLQFFVILEVHLNN